MTTTQTDRYGFPVRPCTRCGGSGHYSYNQINGTVCFGCHGTGLQHPRGKVAEAYKAFAAARRAQREATVGRLAVGDVVTFDFDFSTLASRPARDAVWRTVAAVDVDHSHPVGWEGLPLHWREGHEDHRAADCDECWKVTSYRATVRFTDGTEHAASTNHVALRKGTVDPAPYLATLTPTRTRTTR